MIIDKDILRWVLLIGATPIWLPFLRALWRDFNRALREDGGLMGSQPGPRELEAIRNERRTEADPLHSEPRILPGQRRITRLGGARGSAKGSSVRGGATRPTPTKRAPDASTRKPGFQSRKPPGGR